MTGTVLTTMDLMSISKFLSVSPWIYIIINGNPKYEFLCEATMIVVYEPSLMCFFPFEVRFFPACDKNNADSAIPTALSQYRTSLKPES